MNIVFEIELGLVALIIIFLVLSYFAGKREAATAQPEPTGKPPIDPEKDIKTTVETIQKDSPSWFALLKQDLATIWGKHGVRIFDSVDGNILYVPVSDVEHWSPEEIVFWILVHEDEVYQALKKGTAEIDLLKRYEDFVKNLTQAKVLIEFRSLNVIPSYHQAIQCWKLVLEDLPEAEQVVKNVIVEEIK